MQTFTMKVIHNAFGDDHVHVATVIVESESVWSALDKAYFLTNNIQGSWSRPEQFEVDGVTHDNPDFDARVILKAPLHMSNGETFGLRSTSVDDLIEVDGITYIVADCGFEILETA